MSELYSNLSWLPQPPADFNALCSSALGQPDNLGQRLRALASSALNDNQLLRLSKLITRARTDGHSLAPLTPYRLGLISNSTTDFLAPVLVATAARHGIALECITGSYGQVIQVSLSPDSTINRSAPNAVLLALDWRGFPLRFSPGHAEASRATVDGALEYLHSVRNGVRQNSNAICIVQNLAASPETLFGSLDRALPGSPRYLIDSINRGIAESLQGSPD